MPVIGDSLLSRTLIYLLNFNKLMGSIDLERGKNSIL
jgi:hypothetical protein